MTLGRFLLAFVLAVAGGVGWVAFDDRFGRPDEPQANRPFLPPPLMVNDVLSAGFTLCSGPVRANCVVDGDTFWFHGEKIRIADIDAPETSQPTCPAEREAGAMSRDRLLEILNDGPFRLTSGWRDEDRYGRKLRVVSRSGRSLGMRLVEEGLARRWNGPDFGWCDGEPAIMGANR